MNIRAIADVHLHSRLILVDPKRELCDCWKQQFHGLSGVEIVNGRFEELEEFDCMVSAANSFGLMDGGVDLAIICFFGFELMDRVQERIIRDYLGERPVGTSLIVQTGNVKHPFIAHTPTMRVPMTIANTDYVFAAMWECSLPCISTIATPGERLDLSLVPASVLPAEWSRRRRRSGKWHLLTAGPSNRLCRLTGRSQRHGRLRLGVAAI